MAGHPSGPRGPLGPAARDECWSYHHHAASTGAAVLRRRLSVRHLPPPAVDRAPCSVADCNQLTVSTCGTEQRCRHDHRAVCQSRANANARARIGLSSFVYTCMNVALQRVCEQQRLCQLGKWHGGHADAANRARVRKQSAIMPCHRPDGAAPGLCYGRDHTVQMWRGTRARVSGGDCDSMGSGEVPGSISKHRIRLAELGLPRDK